MRILFFGDIVGRPGRHAIQTLLPELCEKYSPDVILANAENAAGGFGLTAKVIDELFSMGLQVLTTGNHAFDKKEALGILEREQRILRPLNFAPGCPGFGAFRLEVGGGRILWVANFQGKIMMPPIACPFLAADAFLKELPASERCVFVDFHAEATSEKRAFGMYLDGRASVVVGTHTHVPTADGEILAGGTGYLSDAGMTGPYDSVIGMDRADSTKRLLLGMPTILNVAKGDPRAAGLFAHLDDTTGRCLQFEPFVRKASATK